MKTIMKVLPLLALAFVVLIAMPAVSSDCDAEYAYIQFGTEDASGDGYTYVASTKTLTLTDFTITDKYLYLSQSESNIVLVGNNTINIKEASDPGGYRTYGIFCPNDLTISGTGSLTIDMDLGDKDFRLGAFAIYGDTGLTIGGGDITIKMSSTNSSNDLYGLRSGQSLNISGSASLDMTITSSNADIAYGLSVYSGKIAIGGTGTKSIDLSGVTISRGYGIYNEASKPDVTDNGDISISGGKVTLKMGTVCDYAIVSFYVYEDYNPDGTIEIDDGEVEISGTDFIAIFNGSDVRATDSADIIVKDSTLSITNVTYGIASLRNGILFENSDVSIVATYNAIDIRQPLGGTYGLNNTGFGFDVSGNGTVTLESKEEIHTIITNYTSNSTLNTGPICDIDLTEGGSLSVTNPNNACFGGFVDMGKTTYLKDGGKYIDKHVSNEYAFIPMGDGTKVVFGYKAYVEPTLTDDSKYDIASGLVNTKISSVEISEALSNGIAPFTYSKVSGPEWLSIDATDGTITGTRPGSASVATTAVFKVTDRFEGSDTIEISVGEIPLPKVTIQDVTVSGTIGTLMSTKTVTVSIYDGVIDSGEGIVITNLPEGLSQETEFIQGNRVYIYITGTPSAVSSEPIAVKIPKERLGIDVDITSTANPDAKFAIVTPPLEGTVSIQFTTPARFGDTLEADVTEITNNTGILQYQWIRDDAPITGANGKTYVTVEADIGHKLKVIVTSTVQSGQIESFNHADVERALGPNAPAVTIIHPTTAVATDGKITGIDTTMEYSTSTDFTTSTKCTGTEITGLGIGKYYIRVAETATHLAGEYTTAVLSNSVFVVTVNNGTGGGNYASGTDVTIVANAAESGNRFIGWESSVELDFIGGTNAKSATIKFTMPESVVTLTAEYEVIPEFNATVTISGDEVFDSKLTVTVSDHNSISGTFTYQWKRGADVIAGATAAEYRLVADDIGKVITCVVSADDCTGNASKFTGEIKKLPGQGAPIGVTGTDPSEYGASDGRINHVTSSMEYRLSTADSWTAITGTEVTGLAAGTYHVRVAETATQYAGTYAEIELSNPAHDVTFDMKGHGTQVQSQDVYNGDKVVKPADPSETGYTFGGWYKEAGCETAWNFDTDVVTSDVTLYAKWTVNEYTITFDSNGGGDVTSITQDYGTTIVVPADPTKAGYRFDGWVPAVPATMPAENVTCVAQWIQLYAVTFDANGGTGTMESVETVGDYVLPANGFTAPTEMEFKCWSVGGVEKNVGDTINVTAPVTVTAVWKEIVHDEPTYVPSTEGNDPVNTVEIGEGQTTTVTNVFETSKTDNKKVVLEIGDMSIGFDAAAVSAIGGNDVTIKAAIKTEGHGIDGALKVIQVKFTGATFPDGKVTVSIPFTDTVPEGKVVKVYYVDGENRVDMNAVLSEGVLTYHTDHFSDFAVFIEDAPAPSDSGDDDGGFPVWAIVLIVVAVIAVAGGVGGYLFLQQKKKV